MNPRDSEIGRFVECARESLLSRTLPGQPAHELGLRAFAALGRSAPPHPTRSRSDPGPGHAGRPAACAHLAHAMTRAALGPPDLARLTETFRALEPRLTWRPRSGAPADDPDSPVNAMVVGPRGYSPRDDVWLGVSLVAPGVLYPDHSHPPEEAYLVITGGRWRQGAGDWIAPGVGGIVYNPPGIVHAMEAPDDAPLLAVWCLWAG